MSELRRDLVSGDWIIVSPERAGRLHNILPKRKARWAPPKASCPFENLQKSGNWPPIMAYPNERRWKIAVVPNKFPALRYGNSCAKRIARGPYTLLGGVGRHDLVITRDHKRNLGALSVNEGVGVFKMLQRCQRAFARDRCFTYASIFANWGERAGASVYHPHYQLLALPIVPPDVGHSLHGSRAYFSKHKRCVHCEMLAFEKKSTGRIIEQNARAIALAPYVSREPFEVRIYPKRHLPYFEHTPLKDLQAVVALLRSTIRRVKKHLNDPDFNFFIHTSPLKRQNLYAHYHWHIEMLPKISVAAGFELSTGVEINIIDPDRAAAILRGEKVSNGEKKDICAPSRDES